MHEIMFGKCDLTYSIRLHINFLNFLILERQWHEGAQQK